MVYFISQQHNILLPGISKMVLQLFPMPLYSLIITAVHFIVPNWEIAAKLISITSVVLSTIPPISFWPPNFLIAKQLFGPALRLLSHPHLMTGLLMWFVVLFCFFVLWAVYFAQNAIVSKDLSFLSNSSFSCFLFLKNRGCNYHSVLFLFLLYVWS